MKEEITRVLKEVQRSRRLSGADLAKLNELCGERFWKALKAVANDLVKRYIFEPSGREAWVVVGKNRDYRILSDIYCDCEDFYINVIVKRRAEICYHILARVLAAALDAYSEIHLDDMKYQTLRAEWDTLPQPRASEQKKSSSRSS